MTYNKAVDPSSPKSLLSKKELALVVVNALVLSIQPFCDVIERVTGIFVGCFSIPDLALVGLVILFIGIVRIIVSGRDNKFVIVGFFVLAWPYISIAPFAVIGFIMEFFTGEIHIQHLPAIIMTLLSFINIALFLVLIYRHNKQKH